MSARHFYRDVGGTTLSEQTLVPREGWEVKSAAEEGTTPMVTITIPDPHMTLDYSGHRRWMIIEDESTDTDDVLYDGYVADQEIGRIGGEFEEPLGRVWVVSLVDINSLWQRRVMTGTDCNRPAETDVERMQWLLATNEATNWAANYTDYVFTVSPVHMDKVDYRGQMFNQIADDCAQASGKNWYLFYRNNGSAREAVVWYGRDSNTSYSSALSLSNDPADWLDSALIAGTSLVWPISYDTKLTRSPDRVYDGVYEPYDGGAVYRTRAATGVAFDHRDFVAPSLNVKTNTKAVARALRWLNDLDEQDERITTTVRLPKAKATKIKAGMRLQFKATHLPGYEDFGWVRVADCTPKPVAAGAYYDLALTLVGPSSGGAVSCSIALAAAETWLIDTQSYSLHTVTLPIAPSASSFVIAGAVAYNGNTPQDSAMVASGGWATEHSQETPAGAPAVGVFSQAAVTGSTSVTGSYTPGYDPASRSRWAVTAIAIPTASTSLVQDVGRNDAGTGNADATFVSTPTSGNLMVMVAAFRGLQDPPSAVALIVAGWTLRVSAQTINGLDDCNVSIWTKCAGASEATRHGFSGLSNESVVWLGELAIT